MLGHYTFCDFLKDKDGVNDADNVTSYRHV